LPLKISRARFLGLIGGAIAIAVCLSVAYAAYRFFNPYDEVSVTVRGIPPDTYFLCLIAEGTSGPEVMYWSGSKVTPFTTHPDKDLRSFDRGNSHEDRHRYTVIWVGSVRVGVLRRTKAGEWFVSWYKSPKSNLKGRSFLFGGGSWEADLRDADDVEPVSKNQLRAMGMDYALKAPPTDAGDKEKGH
jgi:hypothetical protein